MELETIITLVISVLGLFAGGFWMQGKGKLKKIYNLVSELLDVIDELNTALADDKLSKKELENIKIQFNELKGAFKELFS